MTIETKVKVCTVDELSPADREVVDAARRATANSYAVYSHFNVGAAVRLADDTLVAGTNQENAAYPSGLCAERTTIFWANSQYPSQAVKVLAIAARTDQGELEVPIPPCGPCRQVVPLVEQIAEERPDIKVGKINVDDEPELAREFKIMSIPALFVIRDGEVADKVVGYRNKEALLELLEG